MKVRFTNARNRTVSAALIAAFATAAVGGGAAVASSTKTVKSNHARGGLTAQRVDGDHGRGHGPSAAEVTAFATALAGKLGLTVDQVKSALEAVKPAAGTRPDPSQLPAKLAAQLGKSEAEVKAALDAVRPAH